MKFWFGLGVDGLRLDVANFFMHDQLLRDTPPAMRAETPANPYYLQQRLYDRSRPENLPFLERMRRVAGDRMLLAEISCDHQIERMAEYTASGRLHTAYSFALLCPELDGRQIAEAVCEAGAGESWPTWAFSNHDVMRVATRWQAEGNRNRIKMLHTLLLSLRGTVILYQGEELGLPHADVPKELMHDPEGVRFWPNHRGRDGARTPMAWEDAPDLGFSEVSAWLPADSRHASLSVAAQQNDPRSILSHCRSMIALRRTSPALRLGDFEIVEVDADGLTFLRKHKAKTLLCSFNFSDAPRQRFKLPLSCILAGHADGGKVPANGYIIGEVDDG